MLLSEIFNADISDQTWTATLQSIIDKHGLEKFTGTQATVITSRDRKSVYRIWVKDPGYERWLGVAEQMQDNPHIVKILGRQRTIETRFRGMPKDVKLKFVKLEKLESLRSKQMIEAFVFEMCEVINNWNVSQRQEQDVKSFAKAIYEHSEKWSATSVFAAVKEYIEKYESFLKVVLDLSRKGYNDWTIENIMLRGDVPVITDPLADKG
jgi:hypothetical protein